VRREEVAERDRPVERRSAVVDLDERPDPCQLVAHPAHALAERRVVDEHLGLAVVEQVAQLGVEVPVVDVDRDGAVLERAVLGDQVLRRVVQVQADGGPVPESEGPESAREPGSLLVELGVADATITLDDGIDVGRRVGDLLPHRGEVDEHVPPQSEPAPTCASRRCRVVTRPWPQRFPGRRRRRPGWW
jgi:hypothetical protein